MTVYLAVPLLVILAVLQATIVSRFTVWGVFADLPALVVVSWGLLRGIKEGILWGVIGGLAVDLLSGAPFGAATLSLATVGFLSGLAKQSVFAAHVVFPVVTMFLATLVYELLFLAALWISGRIVAWPDTILRIILPSAILNALLMPPVFWLVRGLVRRFSHAEMEW